MTQDRERLRSTFDQVPDLYDRARPGYPTVRVVKAADALRPGGALATVATHHVAGGDESFFAAAQAC